MEVLCEFNDEDYEIGDEEIILYKCHIYEAAITKPGTEISAFVGEHLPGGSHSDVRVIAFENTTVEFFPRGLHKSFPNLLAIQVSSCELKEISRVDLNGLENIEKLSLSHNTLLSLPSNLLIGMQNLKQISFRDNQLKFLSSKLIQHLAWNENIVVDFRDNDAIDEIYYPEGDFESLEYLMGVIDKNCQTPAEEKEKEEFGIGFVEGLKVACGFSGKF